MIPALVALLAVALLLAVAAILVGRRRRQQLKRRKAATFWRPTVQHQELPRPQEDPAITWSKPQPESLAQTAPPLAQLPLSAGLRGQLDGYALGRAKRVLEAPDLLEHAAADAESWPTVEEAVTGTLELAESRGVKFADRSRLTQALARCAAQGVLLAEWRQLEDGRTPWIGDTAQVRASDAFSVQRVAEVMQRRVLADLFIAIERRPPGFEPATLVPYCTALAFYLRLRGNPPTAFAAVARAGS